MMSPSYPTNSKLTISENISLWRIYWSVIFTRILMNEKYWSDTTWEQWNDEVRNILSNITISLPSINFSYNSFFSFFPSYLLIINIHLLVRLFVNVDRHIWVFLLRTICPCLDSQQFTKYTHLKYLSNFENI